MCDSLLVATRVLAFPVEMLEDRVLLTILIENATFSVGIKRGWATGERSGEN